MRRREIYRQIRQLGDKALPALARGLSDPDVRLRRNVALALGALAGTWWEPSVPKMNIRPMLGALSVALKDEDTSVRAWSAQAIGAIGPDAAPAVPALIALLANSDEGSRNSACVAGRRGSCSYRRFSLTMAAKRAARCSAASARDHFQAVS